MNIQAQNINDDAQELAQEFVNNYPNMFTEDKRFWRDAIAELLRIYSNKQLDYSLAVNVAENKESFEVRKNDRGFKKGDTLILKEYDAEKRAYTGREIARNVTYVLDGKNNQFIGINCSSSSNLRFLSCKERVAEAINALGLPLVIEDCSGRTNHFKILEKCSTV